MSNKSSAVPLIVLPIKAVPVVAQGMTLDMGTVGILTTMLVGSGGVIAFLFRQLIIAKKEAADLLLAEKDRAIKELDSMKKSYQEIAAEALKSATDTANYYRAKEGKPLIIPLAPVIPESHSPSTEKQREAAMLQTFRATMAQIKLTMGQKVRQEPDREVIKIIGDKEDGALKTS